MPSITDFPQGAPLWVDLQTTDAAAAAEFYAGLFGWEITSPSPETGRRWQATSAGTPVCAIGRLPESLVGAAPVWTTYLAVDDADAVAEAIPEACGRVLLPPGRGGRGARVVIASDAIGAVVGLWERGAMPGGWLRDEPGAVTWFELTADDTTGALEFYESVLGITSSTMSLGEVEYPLLSAAGTTFGGVAQADLPNGPAHWRVYFEVEDVAAALEKAVELGATPIGQQESAAGVGRWTALLDPQGALFALLEPESQEQEQEQEQAKAQDDAASTET